jgi:hypothetical protein
MRKAWWVDGHRHPPTKRDCAMLGFEMQRRLLEPQDACVDCLATR